MNRPSWLRVRGRRLMLLGTFAGASLWAVVELGPAKFHEDPDILLQTVANRLWQIRWAWPLAATTALAILTSPSARRRWPQRSRRALLGLAGAVGLIGLITFAETAKPVAVLLMLAGLMLVGLLATWVLVVPIWLAPPLSPAVLDHLSDSERLDRADARLKLQNDLRTTALQAIAGLAVLAGAVLAYQQLTEDRVQAAADRELTRQGQASERFTRAISQLGSDRREVQLGGIYGLEQIAQQAPDNRLAVTEVLVAYLHRRIPRPSTPRLGFWAYELRFRAADAQAALTVLARRKVAPTDPPLDLRELDLGIADLRAADLRGAFLIASVLREANLESAILTGAILTGVDLRDASLREANLTDVDFIEADLTRADLTRADLTRADLRLANLHGTDLKDAALRSAHLCGADLREANLIGADLTGTDLHNALVDDSTKWPDGFDWRRATFSSEGAQGPWPPSLEWCSRTERRASRD